MSGLVEKKKKRGPKGRGRASAIDHGPWLEGTCWKSGGGATEERWGTSDLWTTAYSSTYSKPPSNNTSFEFDKVLCLLNNKRQRSLNSPFWSCQNLLPKLQSNLQLKKEQKAPGFSVKSKCRNDSIVGQSEPISNSTWQQN